MSAEAPRLFLITPKIADAAAFAGPLEAALAAADVACVLVRAAGRDPREAKKILAELAPLAQARDVAVLVEDDPQLAQRVKADGCHMNVAAELAEALAALHPGAIVGIGPLTSRDEAMTAGEAGVDYLMFGGPDSAEPVESVRERVAWWAEIFNIPCVAFAGGLDEIEPLARAGADFVALGDAVFGDPRGAAAAVAEAAAILAALPEDTKG